MQVNQSEYIQQKLQSDIEDSGFLVCIHEQISSCVSCTDGGLAAVRQGERE